MFESIVVITKRTALEELILRFNSRDQAKFYIEQQARLNPGYKGGAFEEYQNAHEVYLMALNSLKAVIPKTVKYQIIERSVLPMFKFSGKDLIVIIGPDGLVINTAKYLSTEPILALNPDSRRIDGVLIPFQIRQAREKILSALEGRFKTKPVSMAQATLNDGQRLFAVNDLFIGAKSHISARYRLEFGRKSEIHSSSGIIVSTGAGSTGWLQSIVNGSCGVVGGVIHSSVRPPASNDYRLDWSSNQLYFAVREPFTSKSSQAGLVFGRVESGKRLTITSLMPDNGVIFSDGIEADYLNFNSGAVASISLADRKANLIVA
ncbi:MAG: sugar kinase [Candidatus Riflebacteria bacterium]|nr:sugar kinase [Candidatus Riflebacteria bacterium]